MALRGKKFLHPWFKGKLSDVMRVERVMISTRSFDLIKNPIIYVITEHACELYFPKLKLSYETDSSLVTASQIICFFVYANRFC